MALEVPRMKVEQRRISIANVVGPRLNSENAGPSARARPVASAVQECPLISSAACGWQMCALPDAAQINFATITDRLRSITTAAARYGRHRMHGDRPRNGRSPPAASRADQDGGPVGLESRRRRVGGADAGRVVVSSAIARCKSGPHVGACNRTAEPVRRDESWAGDIPRTGDCQRCPPTMSDVAMLRPPPFARYISVLDDRVTQARFRVPGFPSIGDVKVVELYGLADALLRLRNEFSKIVRSGEPFPPPELDYWPGLGLAPGPSPPAANRRDRRSVA